MLVLPEAVGGGSAIDNLVRFLTRDIVPAPLRTGSLLDPATWAALGHWFWPILMGKILPGAWQS